MPRAWSCVRRCPNNLRLLKASGAVSSLGRSVSLPTPRLFRARTLSQSHSPCRRSIHQHSALPTRLRRAPPHPSCPQTAEASGIASLSANGASLACTPSHARRRCWCEANVGFGHSAGNAHLRRCLCRSPHSVELQDVIRRLVESQPRRGRRTSRASSVSLHRLLRRRHGQQCHLRRRELRDGKGLAKGLEWARRLPARVRRLPRQLTPRTPRPARCSRRTNSGRSTDPKSRPR